MVDWGDAALLLDELDAADKLDDEPPQEARHIVTALTKTNLYFTVPHPILWPADGMLPGL